MIELGSLTMFNEDKRILDLLEGLIINPPSKILAQSISSFLIRSKEKKSNYDFDSEGWSNPLFYRAAIWTSYSSMLLISGIYLINQG